MRSAGSQSMLAPSPKKLRFSSQAEVASANARLVTASVRPRRRSAGSPMSRATAAPASAPSTTEGTRSHPRRAVRGASHRSTDAHEGHLAEADLTGPTGEHDQRQTDDREDQDRRREVRCGSVRGTRARRAAPRRRRGSPPSARRAPPAAARARGGTGRTSRAACQVETSGDRSLRTCVTSKATTTTTKRIGST